MQQVSCLVLLLELPDLPELPELLTNTQVSIVL